MRCLASIILFLALSCLQALGSKVVKYTIVRPEDLTDPSKYQDILVGARFEKLVRPQFLQPASLTPSTVGQEGEQFAPVHQVADRQRESAPQALKKGCLLYVHLGEHKDLIW